ncbi:hypothetical protein PUN71_012130 [Arthrobacter sp. NQ7]|uniref:Uncharacterized protein n=1 Tax=Pseudarthrobacter enclensis TaxID=993070 RepID=A0ABT9S297_9MICC|nr:MULTISPECIES: hypothetical protein [Micrococcaceae]MDJ0457953.1 hypothetical protein [Arthrobacter sp. NQ7]MDP9890574.1 hypothetical protein [Pseudarthrobacter enclensis]
MATIKSPKRRGKIPRVSRADTDIRIDLGGGSMVSDDISLSPEQVDRAMEKLFDRVKDSFSKELAYKNNLHQFGA